ncbi:MAG: polyprenyl synthetase family protein [Spirochaetaceae bacterium]|jgi:octaprenyl-diphosphate synthase|nr:polyprenyl synthetase family protein [Spirochaetaceae bacterium]
MKDFSAYLEKIEAVLHGAVPVGPDCLVAPIRDMLGRGGKRWRPLLSLLVCEGLGGGDAVVPLLPLVEFSHTASLIHDDIEDNAPLRRGKPACHIIYGHDVAINAGSFLYFLASACIDPWGASADKKAGVFSLWTDYLRRLHTGQAYDIHWHNDVPFIPTVDDYLAMCAMKTGCLAAFAVDLAGFVCGAAAGEKTVLCNAARDLGVGFQIIDDVQNLRGGIAGKKRGDDIVEGKKSLPVILFLEHAGDAGLRLVEETFQAARADGIDSPAVESLIAAMEDAGVIDRAQERGNALLDGAFASFAAYPWAVREETEAAFRELRNQMENAASKSGRSKTH